MDYTDITDDLTSPTSTGGKGVKVEIKAPKNEAKSPNVVINHSWAHSDFGCALSIAVIIIAVGLYRFLTTRT